MILRHWSSPQSQPGPWESPQTSPDPRGDGEDTESVWRWRSQGCRRRSCRRAGKGKQEHHSIRMAGSASAPHDSNPRPCAIKKGPVARDRPFTFGTTEWTRKPQITHCFNLTLQPLCQTYTPIYTPSFGRLDRLSGHLMGALRHKVPKRPETANRPNLSPHAPLPSSP